MIVSMTGIGTGQVARNGITATAEVRSVNSRFLEISTRLPRSLMLRENDAKELVRRKISRGKITVLVTLDRDAGGSIPMRVNVQAARAYYRLLNELRRSVRLRHPVKLEHLLQFSEIMEPVDAEEADNHAWAVTQLALESAVAELHVMRRNEGRELEADFRSRIALLEERLARVGEISLNQVPRERERLRERIAQLLEGRAVDEGRLEMELALLADRLDVTEECVRFRSHNKFFLEALASDEASGRKLNFLIQEMNREANTIGSKSSSTEIAHLVVGIKEELEKIREQLQNIE